MKNTIKYIIILLFFYSCKISEPVVPYFDIDPAKAKYIDNEIRVYLNNKSEGGISYKWDFGDGVIKSSFNPDKKDTTGSYHVYERGGTYNITLTVMGNANIESITKTIKIPELVPGFSFSDIDSIDFNKIVLTMDEDYATKGNVEIYWDYGDGESCSTIATQSHKYYFKNGGKQSVTLRLKRNDEVSEITNSITLPSLSPDFTVNQDKVNKNKYTFPTSIINVIDVKKTAQNKKSPSQVKVDYDWNFGDGNNWHHVDDGSGTIPTFSHEYTSGGIYPVTLKITQGTESKEISKSVDIDKMAVDFTVTKNGNNVTFDLLEPKYSTATYDWDWGDGSVNASAGTGQQIHPYANGGLYVVTLTVTKGTEVKTAQKVVNLPTIGVDFKATVDATNHKKYTFTPTVSNGSSNDIYMWNLGDGKSSTSSVPFEHTYTAGGTYVISLSVTQGNETKSVTKTIFIESLSACFEKETIRDNYYVKFKDCSKNTDGASYFWNFGDGQSSTVANPPEHEYKTGGIYNVSLTIDNGSESTSHSQTVGISILTPCFNFETNNYNVDFNSSCSLNTLSNATYTWDFGDGTPSGNGITTSHSFAAGGVYDVSLTISQGPESKTISKSVTIASIVPSFIVNMPSNCVAPCAISFQSNSLNLPIGATISWNFGDNQTGTGSTTTNTYASGGVYTVIMTITSNGKDYSISKIINVPKLTASFNILGGGCNSLCDVLVENTSTNIPQDYRYFWCHDYNSSTSTCNSGGFVENANSSFYIEDNLPGTYTVRLEIRKSDGTSVVKYTTRSYEIKGEHSVNLYDGLIAFYPFTGTLDNTVGSNMGIVEGIGANEDYYFDRFGRANQTFEFDGSTYINTNEGLLNTTELSVSFWMKQINNDYSNTGNILSSDQIYIGYDNNQLEVGTGTSEHFAINPLSSWIHVVVIYNKNATTNIYFNGVSKANGTWSGSFAQGDDLVIGEGRFPGIGIFEGYIDDIRIYSRAINEAEVEALYDIQTK